MRDRLRPGAGRGAADVRFTVLGEPAVEVDGQQVPLGPHKQRTVLALLLCRANTWVPVEVLIEAVWPDDPPRTARKNLQGYVSALRKLMVTAGADDRITHGAGGYRMRVADGELDLLRFTALVRAGRVAVADGAAATAVGLLDRALELWSGPPLPEMRRSPVLCAEADRLSARHLGAWEDWAELALDLGRASEVADAASELVAEHPLRERLCSVQMAALERSGRRSEALAAYSALRQAMSRELGLPPSPALDARYRSILAAGAERRPGARADVPPPTSLPATVGDFTGRTGYVRTVVEAVSAGGVTVAVGPTGVGKTALAVHVAHRVAGDFPGGRIAVRLCDDEGAPRSRASVLAELGRYAGPAGWPDDPAEATAAWQVWLAGRRVLLLLDDAPDETTVRPLLPVGGRSAVIVTARTPLAGLAPARRVEVPPFGYAEAVELLGRIIGLGRLRSDPAAAERIVELCGRLPLAVRVAGLKLTVLRHLPLGEFAERLADPGSALDQLAVGDLAVRPRLAREWRHLEPSVRTTLMRLSGLPQPFTVDEAAGVLCCGPVQALCAVERLIETGAILPPESEVIAHAALYSVPRFTRLYALERDATSTGGQQ